MKVIIKAEYARLIQPFVADEETRFYLNGFFVHRDRNEGVRVVATDGCRLAVFHDETGSCDKPEGVIVKLDKYALAFLKRDHKMIVASSKGRSSCTSLPGTTRCPIGQRRKSPPSGLRSC